MHLIVNIYIKKVDILALIKYIATFVLINCIKKQYL